MIVEARKRCPKCSETKPVSAFQRNRSRADGLQDYCRLCHSAAAEKVPSRPWRKLCTRANAYGLTVPEVETLLCIPACQACGCQFENETAMKFDHCHTGGHVRGVLCHKCNLACAGTAVEAMPRLRGCIEYLCRDLERFREQG